MNYIYKVMTLLAFVSVAFFSNANAQFTVSGSTGANGTYTSLTNVGGVFAAINGASQTGNNIIVSVTGSSTSETGATSLNSGSWITLTISPSGGAARTISGAANSSPLVKLKGAGNVTINGLNTGGNSLTISNTSTSGNGTCTIQFVNDAQNNSVLNSTILGSAGSGTANGIFYFGTSNGAGGNDNNTIDRCNITNAGGRPINAIYSFGTPSNENSGNIISNNNIYDFMNAGNNSFGINLLDYSTAWTLTGNSFYETTNFAASANSYYPICINYTTTGGNNFVVNNNSIGGSATACGGTAWMVSGGNSSTFSGIFIKTMSGIPSSIQNNTIKNINWNASANGNMPWIGIEVAEGDVNVGTVTGNTIGASVGTGSIVITNSVANSTSYGIYVTSTGTTSIRNNTIGSITTVGSGSISHSFSAIMKTSNSTMTTISSNNIGSTGTANSINASSASTNVTGQNVYGIYSNGGGPQTISTNTIANLNNNYALNAANDGQIAGIFIREMGAPNTNTVQNNTVKYLSTTSGNNTPLSSASVIGISVATIGTPSQMISGNTIHLLSNTNSSEAVHVSGIFYSGPSTGTNTVDKNFVHSLSVTSSNVASVISGITTPYLTPGTTTFSNNLINLGSGVSAGCIIYGLFTTPASVSHNANVYFNTVYIGGTASGSSGNTFAYNSYSPNANLTNVRNNIFNNSRSGGLPSHHYAIGVEGPAGFSSTFTINFNDYFAPGSNGVLGKFGVTDNTTLGAWQASTLQDVSSLNTNPLFLSAGGTHINDYTISGVLQGTPGTGITVDITGATRGVIPKMGAVEVLACTPPAAPTGSASQTYCTGTIATLVATGTSIQWYAAASGGIPLLSGQQLVNGTHYYASQTISGCESTNRFDVTVTLTGPVAPTGTISQPSCNPSTVANLVAFGTGIQWYAAPSGGLPLSPSTPLVTATHYYATQTINGCESTTRSDVLITLTTTPPPTGASPQTFACPATVSSLVATGSGIVWYDSASGGSVLPGTTNLVNGRHYYATQTISGCQSATRLDVLVNLTGPPAPTGASTQTFTCIANVSNLVASGSNIQWYLTPSGGTPLSPTSLLVHGTHYYGSQTINGCESSTRLDVLVNLTTPAAPTGNASQSFCNPASVSNLVATGTNIQWYSVPTGGTPLAPGQALVNGTHYYASQTVAACESATRLDVTVTLTTVAAPTGTSPQAFCQGVATVANLVATGTSIQWYLQMIGGTPLSPGTILVDGQNYYASQTISGCESTLRLIVLVSIGNPAAPSGSATQTLCTGGLVSSIATTVGVGVQWYLAPSGGTPLSPTTPLISGTHYYGTQTIGGCESTTRLDVLVTLVAPPGPPTGSANQSGCPPVTIGALIANGNNIQWFDAPTGGNQILAGTNLANGTHYYAQQSNAGCNSTSRLDVLFTFIITPAPTGVASQVFCSSGTVADLTATGTAIQWYAASTGGSPLSPSDPLVNGTHYYASQTVSGCESATRFDVTVTFGPQPPPTGNATQTFCSSGTVADLTATGTNIQWYAAASGGSPLSPSTPLVNGTHYYATQTVLGCESASRLDVTVVFGPQPAPTGSASQTFCNSGTVASLTATGSNIQWYAAATGGSPLSSTTALVNGTSYYASQTVLGCQSTTRLNVTVTITITPAPTGTATQTFCAASTVANLTATGTGIQWYGSPVGGNPLLSSTALVNGNHYYATQTVAGCESATRLDVTFTLGAPAAPTGNATQTFCNSGRVSDLTATGTGIQWFSSPSSTTPLSSTAALVNGSIYYATQTVGSCQSTSRLMVTVTLATVNIATTLNTGTITASAVGATYQWLNCTTAFSAISGATSQNYSPPVAGSYAVRVTENNCSDTSACVQVTIVGIANTDFSNQVTLYPNPATSSFSINVQTPLSNADIRILDMNGRVMTEVKNQNGTEFSFSVSEFSHGIYFVEIENQGGIIRKKIVKE